MSNRGKSGDGKYETGRDAVERQMIRLATTIYGMERTIETWDEEDVFFTSLTIRDKRMEGGGWLAIVKARGSSGNLVAFHGGDSFAECVRGVVERMINKSLKFREDTPYGS
jgi:hypothetical protein